MKQQELTLEATPREPGGKLLEARKKGLIPAVIYGNNSEPVSIFLDRIEFQKTHKVAGRSSVVNLVLQSKKIATLIHDISYDRVSHAPGHIDFLLVDTVHTMHAVVPLEFIGIAPAIKEHKAFVVKLIHEIEVEAMASSLPHSVSVDLSSLIELSDHITVGDIVFPEGVTTHHKKDTIVASLDIEESAQPDTEV
jgi:large subunit ribosomal protein L25